MNTDAASLDRLHDIVLPPAVSWWPLAPGWYVIFILLVLTIAYLGWRLWKKRKANAYRRAALQELTEMKDASSIAELLRRTALAVVPRSAVAEKSGPAWADWLAGQCPDPMVQEVHQLLGGGVYSRSAKEQNIGPLRDYAACWIAHHHILSNPFREKIGE